MKTQKETKDELALLSGVMEAMPAIVYVKEKVIVSGKENWQVVWINRFGLEVLGIAPEELPIAEAGLYSNQSYTLASGPGDLPLDASLLAPIYEGEVILRRFQPKDQSEFMYVYERSCLHGINWCKTSQRRVVTGLLFTQQMLNHVQVSCLLKEIHRSRHQPLFDLLTKRETEIVGMIMRGKTDDGIASLLHICQATAKKHRYNVMQKMRARNTAELVAIASEYGL